MLGRHKIKAQVNGRPGEVEVMVDESVVERLQESMAEAVRCGNSLYLDFNHADGGASGWVKGFRWAGDGPTTGGIMATVDWTDAGKAALAGRGYRKFSPNFFVDQEGHIIGTGENAGGLVNRPAFRQRTAVAT